MVNPLVATLQRPVRRRRNARRLVVESPMGVNEERFLLINDSEQWVTIRGANRANPVLVVLHGGPGSSYIPFNPWLTEWEQHFTVVQWDQPGAGKTFQRNGHTDERGLSLSRLAADGIELTRQIRDIMQCPKVILLGSSVGSLIGPLMAQRQPELFHAYVGVNQNSPGSDTVTYGLVRQAVEAQGDSRRRRQLDAMGADPSCWTIEQYERLMKLAISVTTGVPDMVYDLMLPALMFAPGYTMRDIKDYERAMTFTLSQMFTELRAFDRRPLHDEFAIPVFFFLGERDIIAPISAAQEYFSTIRAPIKDFAIIDSAGHLAEFANPRRVLEELLRAETKSRRNGVTS
jgi:pimeloyl-ACP methyl ester carboxylesterase